MCIEPLDLYLIYNYGFWFVLVGDSMNSFRVHLIQTITNNSDLVSNLSPYYPRILEESAGQEKGREGSFELLINLGNVSMIQEDKGCNSLLLQVNNQNKRPPTLISANFLWLCAV